jgi:hypothetical protein
MDDGRRRDSRMSTASTLWPGSVAHTALGSREADRIDAPANRREPERLAALMSAYARGEDRVFEELYRLLAPRLFRFCRRLATHRSEADDLLQETFPDGRQHTDERYDTGVARPGAGLAKVVASELERMSERNRVAYILLRE